MNLKIKYLILLIVGFVSVNNLFGTKRYWVSAVSSNWNNTANWAATSGGSGGASLPTTTDSVYFDGNGNGNCSLDVNVTIRRLEFAANYTGIFDQGAFTLTVTGVGLYMYGGTFQGGTANLAFGIIDLNGGVFTSTSAILNIYSNYSFSSGTFNHNSGIVKFRPAGVKTFAGSTAFNDVEIIATQNGSQLALSSGSTMTMNNFTVSGTYQTTLAGPGTLDVKGDITITNNYSTVNSISLGVTGTGDQHIYGFATGSGFNLPAVTVNKPSGTLFLHDYIPISGGLVHISGNIDPGNSTIGFTWSQTITGTFNLNNLVFAGHLNFIYTLTNANITANGNVSVQYGTTTGYCRMLGGQIHVKGNVAVSNTANTNHYSGTQTNLILDGTGNQTITGSTTPAASYFPGFTINKPSGTLFLVNNISVNGDWNYQQGTIDQGTSTIVFGGTQTISGSQTIHRANFTTGTQTISAGSTITVDDVLTISGGVINTGNIDATGNITIANNSVAGGGNAILTINGNGDQIITGNTTVGWSKLPTVVINKPGGSLTVTDKVSIGTNFTYTAGTIDYGTSTIGICGTGTITGSQTLNNLTIYAYTYMTVTIASGTAITVNGLLKTSGAGGLALNTGTIYARGNIEVAGTAISGGGSATIVIDGSGTQTLTGNSTEQAGPLPKVTISKDPASTLVLSGLLSVRGNWTYTSGIIDAGTSTIVFGSALTITGSHALNNVTFTSTANQAYTIASGTTLTTNGTLALKSAFTLTLNVGTIHAKGNITVTNTNTSTSGGGSATILINGAGAQTLTGSGTAGAGYLPKIQIDKPSGTLMLSSVISCSRDWIYVQGDIESIRGNSQVVFIGNYNLDGEGTSGTMQFNKIVIGANTRTLTGNLNLRSTLNLQSGTTLAAGAYNINIGGDWKQANSTSNFTSTTGTVTFDGSNYVEIIRNAGASTAIFPKLSVNKTGGSIKLNSPVQVTNNLTLTQGIIKAIVDVTSSNYLELTDNATCTGGSDNAFVHGTIRKTGNDSIVFPLGDTTLPSGKYHPLGISAPANVTDRFEASYYGVEQTLGDSIVDSLDIISDCEYWKLSRLTGNSNVKATCGWNINSCNTGNLNDMAVAGWDGYKWIDLGSSNLTINESTGNVTTNGPISLPMPVEIVLANKGPSVPYAVLRKKLDGGYYKTVNGQLYFRSEEKYRSGTLNFKVYSSNPSSSSPILVNVPSSSLFPGTRMYGVNWFRLNLNGLSGFISNSFYILEIANDKGQKEFLRFKYL